jgi:hypothetical protein
MTVKVLKGKKNQEIVCSKTVLQKWKRGRPFQVKVSTYNEKTLSSNTETYESMKLSGKGKYVQNHEILLCYSKGA